MNWKVCKQTIKPRKIDYYVILGLDILDHIIDEIHPFYVMRSISNKLQFEIETQVEPKLSGLN